MRYLSANVKQNQEKIKEKPVGEGIMEMDI